jgi:hypothetical protein
MTYLFHQLQVKRMARRGIQSKDHAMTVPQLWYRKTIQTLGSVVEGEVGLI